MNPSSYDKIEGFKQDIEQALIRQQSIRERSIYAIPQQIAGCEVGFITLKSYSLLRWANNAFVCGGSPSLADAVSFIWLHSTNFVESNGGYSTWLSNRRRKKIAKNIKLSDIAEVMNFVNEQFQDLNDGSESDGSKPKPPLTGEILPLVDMVVREYHWSEEEVFNMPVARLWQYVRLIRMKDNPEYKPLQLTDHVVDEYVLKFREIKHGGR